MILFELEIAGLAQFTGLAGAGLVTFTDVLDVNSDLGAAHVEILSWSYRTDGATTHSQTLVVFDPAGAVADGVLKVDLQNNLAFEQSCSSGIYTVPRNAAGNTFQISFVTAGKAQDATFRVGYRVVAV